MTKNSISNSFSTIEEVNPKPLPVFETAKFLLKLYTKNPDSGNPYSVALVENNGNRHPVLIASEEFDLDKVELLNGLQVSVRPTENGIRLKPLSQQPTDLITTLSERISNLSAKDISINSDFVVKQNAPSLSNSNGDKDLSIVSMLRGVISQVAEQCQERGLASAAWIFFPVDKGEDYTND